MDDVRLANWVAGIDPGPIEAWLVTSDIAGVLGVNPGAPVFLSDYTLTKTRFRHPEIKFPDYLRLPTILADGYAASGNKKGTVEIAYITQHGNYVQCWRTVLKVTRAAGVFVSMIHKYNLKDARRVYRRAVRNQNLIRDHKGQLARSLLARARQA